MKLKTIAIGVSLSVVAMGVSAGNDAVNSGEYIAFFDHTLPIEERLDDISARLTDKEKGHMITLWNEGVPRYGLKSFMPGEALHGLAAPRKNAATVFPQSIGLAATWQPEALKRMGDAVSDEARAQYHNGPVIKDGKRGPLTFWSPVINIARDPRWGRTQEAYGEDPLLNGVMASAYVKGLQGDHPKYLKTAAGAKHFVANNEEHNRFNGNANISEKQLREYYFPAYKQVVEEANAQIVMTAYNKLNNEPAVTNTWLVRDVLRGEWGFDGFVLGDYGSVLMTTKGWGERSFHGHDIYDNYVDATAAVLNAETLDFDNTRLFRQEAMTAIAQNKTTSAQLDRAFRNTMRVGLRLGMFDPEELSPWKDIPFETMTTFKPLALELAEKSMVLLQNEPVNSQPVLPIDKSTVKSVAVIGPNANVLNFGTYSGTAKDPITPLQGIRDYLGDDIDVIYVPWTQNQGELNPIPLESITLLDNQGLGVWTADYYTNRNGSGKPVANNTVGNIDFDFGNKPPHKDLGNEHFAVKYTTTIVPPQSGLYTLGVESQGYEMVFDIDGSTILRDHGNNSEPLRTTAELELDSQKTYTFTVLAMEKRGSSERSVKFGWELPSEDSIYEGAELEAAKKADVVIAVMGLSTEYERESIDRTSEGLPSEQIDLLRSIIKVNPKTAVVLQSGSSIESPWLKSNVPAILQSWYPGEQGGAAIANTLFGDNNPGGKLPLTFVKSWSDLPAFNDYDISKGRTYLYFDKEPLWAFGHGLSYTQFALSDMKIKSSKVAKDGHIDVTVTVENTGKKAGDEVVQVYITDMFERSEKPKQRLKAFERVSLEAGESKQVNLSIDVSDLAYWDEKTKGWMLGDKYEIRVGNASDNILLTDTINVE
ncbi:beta-glucosidase [Photobacterium gaetbulicola]|uniref:Beta-D-glucoside glucohydrolase n=1 Tax=Photobacterium gaetbulicola Gung47 TaxID=658445 RepID=A0A0C5W1N4_9GAMM|nr:glycoside hydrolase family 3 C-terminal domain-containing protein [Photobacterium gaetbulicola]AJR05231.1 putative beta-glucosidase (gentiobiase) [Photobacterium gaetbulicola Gung47]PSU06063.1 beta-glucosidase [Photobacterium gaetbulicola]